MHFKDIEELTQRSATDIEAAQAVALGDYTIGPVDPEEEEVVEEETGSGEVGNPEPPKEESPEPSANLSEGPKTDYSIELEEMDAKLRKENEAKIAKLEEDFKKQLEENNRRLEEQLKAEQAASPEPVKQDTSVNIDLDEEDPDLATGFERNTRKLMQQELNNLREQAVSPEILTKLESLEKRLSEQDKARELQEKEAEEKRRVAENRRRTFETLDNFSKDREGYAIPVKAEDAYAEHTKIKKAIALDLGIKDPDLIEQKFRRVIREDSAWAEAQRGKLAEKGIAVPEYANNYLNLVEIFEYQKGIQFDVKEGKYKEVGLSLDDIYKFKNLDKEMTTVREQADAELQKKLQEQDRAAITIDDNNTGAPEGDDSYTLDEIRNIDVSQLSANPNLARKYAKFYSDNGIPVPQALKKMFESK